MAKNDLGPQGKPSGGSPVPPLKGGSASPAGGGVQYGVRGGVSKGNNVKPK